MSPAAEARTRSVSVELARPDDAGEVLTVQRAAYVTEAQLYHDPDIPPLTESLDEVRAAIDAGGVFVARLGGRVVGSVRGTLAGDVCHVGRLVVAPDMQGRGVGTALLDAVEGAHAGQARSLRLFTGERSEGNLRLYRRCGYRYSHTERISENFSFVHLRKDVGGSRTGS